MARGASSAHKAQCLWEGSCRNHDLTIAWGPTHLAESPSSTSVASPLAAATLQCGGVCAAQPLAWTRTRTSQAPSGLGGFAVSALPHGAGWMLGQEGCWQGSGQGCRTVVALSLQSQQKLTGSGGLALRKLPAKDCGGQPPLALH